MQCLKNPQFSSMKFPNLLRQTCRTKLNTIIMFLLYIIAHSTWTLSLGRSTVVMLWPQMSNVTKPSVEI